MFIKFLFHQVNQHVCPQLHSSHIVVTVGLDFVNVKILFSEVFVNSVPLHPVTFSTEVKENQEKEKKKIYGQAAKKLINGCNLFKSVYLQTAVVIRIENAPFLI